MSRMKTIATMLDDGASINDIANQLQQWNRSIDRQTALSNAYQFMKEWRSHANSQR